MSQKIDDKKQKEKEENRNKLNIRQQVSIIFITMYLINKCLKVQKQTVKKTQVNCWNLQFQFYSSGDINKKINNVNIFGKTTFKLHSII